MREVKNACETYELMLKLEPYSVNDLLTAHRMMMSGLISENGRFRSGDVGVFDGNVVVHMAPPAQFVPQHIHDLFAWYKQSEMHPLIKSAIFHYEFEFIHPFADGNGRMGRMWHSLLLGKWNELFYWLPIEELIRSRQQEYYDDLGVSDENAESSTFVEMLLKIILDTLKGISVVGRAETKNKTISPALKKMLSVIGNGELSVAEIMKELGLPHRPTFRKNYIEPALEQGLIEMTVPDKPNSRNQRYRRV